MAWIMIRGLSSSPAPASLIRRLSVPSPSLIKLPDCTNKEVEYVDGQVNSILHPKCLSHIVGNDVVSLFNNNGSPLVDAVKPEVFESIFPPVKGLVALKRCVDVVRESYPNFQIPKKYHDSFKRNLRYPLLAERTAAALKCYEVDESQLHVLPPLVYLSLKELPIMGSILDVSEGAFRMCQSDSWRSTVPLRGTIILNRIKQSETSLRALGFEELAENLLKRCIKRFENARSSTMNDVDNFCSQILMKDLRFQMGVFKGETKELSVDAQSLARNYYILKNFLGLVTEDGKINTVSEQFFFRSLLRMRPLETLITLKSYYGVVKQFHPEMSEEEFLKVFFSPIRERCQPIIFSSPNFPVTCRAIFFSNMGFSPEEVVQLLLSNTFSGMQSTVSKDVLHSYEHHRPQCEGEDKNGKEAILHFTHPAFLPVMKRRLEILRTNGDNLKLRVIDAPEHFAAMKSWPSVMRQLGKTGNENQTTSIFNANSKTKTSLRDIKKFLAMHFSMRDENEVKALNREVTNSMNVDGVELVLVAANVKRLEEHGFNKDQIIKALPLLCYPTQLILQKLQDVKSMDCSEEFKEVGEDHSLNVALYLIEKEFRFSNDGIFMFRGSLDQKLSPSFSDEVCKHSKEQQTDGETDVVFETELDAEKHLRESAEAETKTTFVLAKASVSPKRMSMNLFSTLPQNCEPQSQQFRRMSTGTKSFKRRMMPYLQDPLVYVENQLRAQGVQNSLDPDFDILEVARGAKQAVSTLTQMISGKRLDDMRGLLSDDQYAVVERKIESEWSEDELRRVSLDVEDIDAVHILNITRHEMPSRVALLDVKMRFLSYRDDKEPKAGVVIIATLTRTYHLKGSTDWTFTNFELASCQPIVD